MLSNDIIVNAKVREHKITKEKETSRRDEFSLQKYDIVLTAFYSFEDTSKDTTLLK